MVLPGSTSQGIIQLEHNYIGVKKVTCEWQKVQLAPCMSITFENLLGLSPNIIIGFRLGASIKDILFWGRCFIFGKVGYGLSKKEFVSLG